MFKRKSTNTIAMCMYVWCATQQNLKNKTLMQTTTYSCFFFTKSNKVAHAKTCSRIRYMRVVFEFWKCSHCPRNTICARERTPKQLQWSCIPDLHTTNIEIHAQKHNISTTNQQKQLLETKKENSHKHKILKRLLCKGRIFVMFLIFHFVFCFNNSFCLYFICWCGASKTHKHPTNKSQQI